MAAKRIFDCCPHISLVHSDIVNVYVNFNVILAREIFDLMIHNKDRLHGRLFEILWGTF